jgi:myosin heavy subunit
MNTGFPNLSGGQDAEETFWSSFSNVMMVILKIFLLVMIALALNNHKLLEDLKQTLLAKESAQEEAQQAFHLAQSRLKANASLEEQLEYYEQLSSNLQTELLRSRSETENARKESSRLKTELIQQQSFLQEQADTIASREKTLEELRDKYAGLIVDTERIQSELTAVRSREASKDTEISSLLAKIEEKDKYLIGIQGELTELDKRYQKLIQPARSSKNKHVVEVVYQKTGYSIRKSGEENFRTVDRDALEGELAALKTFYGNELYVKIIIPDNSGLSYSEGWKFTSSILSRFDYYYQSNNDVPDGPADVPSP